MQKKICFITWILAFNLISGVAVAQNKPVADRDQPTDIEADHSQVDDRSKVYTFTGNAILKQGSLIIKGNKVVVKEGADGYRIGNSYGTAKKQAYFEQKRQVTGGLVKGQADRIEYNNRTEIAKLFGHAWIDSEGDTVTGDYIEYDTLTQHYVANSKDATSNKRVYIHIEPKDKK